MGERPREALAGGPLLADGAGEVDAIARALGSTSIRHVVIAARGSSGSHR